jgi:N-acetylneuraminic acid mutarotase
LLTYLVKKPLQKPFYHKTSPIIECVTFEGAKDAMPISLKLFANEKNILALILLSLTALWIGAIKPVWSSADAVEDSWVSKAPMQEARGGLGVAVVNGKIYAIGGSTGSGYNALSSGIVGTNEEYDPATDTWTFKTLMPTPRQYFAIAVCQNKIYCIGGTTGYSSDTGYALTGVNEVYDPATDTWETKASMPTARGWLQANFVGGKIYLIGGAPNGTLNEVYDPAANTWETKMPMPTGAIGYASAVVDNKIYIFWATLNQIYDPATDSWSQGASPPRDVLGAAGATTGALAPKRIYVISAPGNIGPGYQPPCFTQVYDPANRDWATAANITTNRSYFGVAVVNDKLYAIGGDIFDFFGLGTPSAVNEQYTPIGYGTPGTTDQSQSPLLIYAVAAGAAAITIIIITAVALKKRHQKKTS